MVLKIHTYPGKWKFKAKLGCRIHKAFKCVITHFVWDGNVPLHELVPG